MNYDEFLYLYNFTWLDVVRAVHGMEGVPGWQSINKANEWKIRYILLCVCVCAVTHFKYIRDDDE